MKTIFLLIILCVTTTPFLFSQDGHLDGQFGNNGIAVFNFPTGDARILSMITSGDYLYAAGFTSPQAKQVFSVMRFTKDGDVDNSFGDNGVLSIPLGTGFSNATRIIEQSAGKFIVTGWARFNNKDQFVLARVKEDGTVDGTFGIAGVATGSWSDSDYAEDEIYDAKFLSDGRIIVVGKSYNGQNNDVVIACFDPDGIPCSNFGNGGFQIITFAESVGDETASSIVVDAEDNIFVGGSIDLSLSTESSFFLIKLDSLGVRDQNFGVNGRVFHTIAPEIAAGLNAMLIDHEGRLITAGGAFNTDELDNNFFLTRYSREGVIDQDFGENGSVILQRIDNESINELEIMPSGDIIAAGSTGGFPSKFAIVRMKDNGDQDLTFGTNGWATTLIGNAFNGIESIELDADGSIYAGGYAYSEAPYKIAIAKYQNTITAIPPGLIDENEINVFPNPTKSSATLSLTTRKPTKFSIQITNVDGQNLNTLSPEVNLNSGYHEFKLPLTNLTPGSYFLLLHLGDHTISKTIIVGNENDK